MTINKNDIAQFDKLISKFHFDDPVSDDFKRFQKKRKKGLYKKILKRIGIYTLFTGTAISLFFWIKKLSAIFGTKLIGITIVITVMTPSVIIYKMMTHPERISIREVIEHQPVITPPPAPVKAAATDIRYTLGLQMNKSGSVTPETLNNINRYMLQSLRTAKNDRYAAFISDTSEEKVSYIVYQSVENLNDTFHIQIKIVDKTTSAIIFATKGTAASEDKLHEVCDDIARQVSSAVK